MGSIEIYDLRTSTKNSKVSQISIGGELDSDYKTLTNSITSADFIDPNSIATRDYLAVRIWDIRMLD